MHLGDALRLETPGGGGYGDPLERNVELVVEDVRREYYDRPAAARQYGVVMHPTTPEADLQKTAELRAQMRHERAT